jgi:hypothetical protein
MVNDLPHMARSTFSGRILYRRLVPILDRTSAVASAIANGDGRFTAVDDDRSLAGQSTAPADLQDNNRMDRSS